MSLLRGLLALVLLLLLMGGSAFAQDGGGSAPPPGAPPSPATLPDGPPAAPPVGTPEGLPIGSPEGPGADVQPARDPGSTRPATRTGNPAPATAFFLVVVLGLFGYHLYSSYSLNGRIDRLEELVRRGGGGSWPGRDELVPFSWDAVVRSLESGLPFLPGVPLPRPGLVVVGTRPAALAPLVLANIVRNILEDPDLVAVTVTRFLGQEELGRRLLSQEAGSDWALLDSGERAAAARRLGGRMKRYEQSLYCMTDLVLTPRQLFETCRELLQEGELGGILLDSLEVLAPEGDESGDLLDHLRTLSLRCHVPVVLVVPVDSPVWESALAAPDRFLSIVEVSAAGSVLSGTFHRHVGPVPALTLALDASSGRLSPAGAAVVPQSPKA